MDYRSFKNIAEEAKKKNPILFALESDEKPSQTDIDTFEKENRIILPQKYKDYILDFGGGYFGFANIYSLDKNSDFYMLKHNNLPFDKYVRIADNGCGDYYLLRIENGKCLENIFFYGHETGTDIQTEYSDVLEYLAAVGLKMEI